MPNASSSCGDLDTVANALQSFPDRLGNLPRPVLRCQETNPEWWRNVRVGLRLRGFPEEGPADLMADTLVSSVAALVQLIIVLWIAGTSTSSAIPRMIPGDPIESRLHRSDGTGWERSVDVAAMKEVWNHEAFVFDQPLYHAIHELLDRYRRRATWAFPSRASPSRSPIRSARLYRGRSASSLVSSIIAFLIGTAGRRVPGLALVTSIPPPIIAPFILLSAIPYYLLAILLLIFIFAATLGWFPGAGGA